MSKFIEKSVTISRALKEKNRWAGKLKELRDKIRENNSHEQGQIQSVDVAKAIEAAEEAEEMLIAVKTAIATANTPIVGKIVELEEVKGKIAFYRDLQTKEGVFRTFKEITETYVVTISGSKKNEILDELQKRANNLQDELDDFNSSHRVKIKIEAI